MTDIFLGPKRYVQKPGALDEAARHLAPLGRRPAVLADERVMGIVRPRLESPLAAAGLEPAFIAFGPECSFAEVARVAGAARALGADVMVGAGGGKAIDTARAASGELGLPLATLPTSAATCSATSAVSVFYERGMRTATRTIQAAEVVLVDSTVVAAAPARLLAAGIGDSLAKWYEGKPTYERVAAPSPALEAAMLLSARLKETLFECGSPAMRDAGGDAFRVALAHGLLYGMTVHPRVHDFLHGEVVSYGLVVQTCMQGLYDEAARLIPFLDALGLPLTLADLGLEDREDPRFMEGLRRTCAPGSSAHTLGIPLDEARLLDAILDADERVAAWRGSRKRP
ncbi:MAG: iron-containing alcohol dehydrogenase [Desulfobacterales bacterium]|nr:iron-containing alcohol dehydrogenase [Desulfobacterales bacterium]